MELLSAVHYLLSVLHCSALSADMKLVSAVHYICILYVHNKYNRNVGRNVFSSLVTCIMNGKYLPTAFEIRPVRPKEGLVTVNVGQWTETFKGNVA
jgi:hypothetical protein